MCENRAPFKKLITASDDEARPSEHPEIKQENFAPMRPPTLSTFPRFIADGSERRAEITETARRLFPGSVERTIREADEICAHIFDLLGSGKTCPGQDINWQRDFKSGFSWDPRRRYDSADQYIRHNDSSDVKVPWDLSSFLHLPTLGKAYWYTDNHKYAHEFVEEVTSWIDHNPRPLGINWTCTMKVAHRAINWAWGYHFFRRDHEIPSSFWKIFRQSIREHGRFIRNNLERERPTSNHYLLGLAGLFYLGLAFPGLKESFKWAKFGRKQLTREITVQIHPDGGDYEGSIYYHCFAAEIFLSVLALGKKNRISFPDTYHRRLEKALEFIKTCSKPDGSSPRIGDSDDGRVQILSDYPFWNRLDHRHLLSTGAVIFNRPDFKAAAGKFYEESFWLLGNKGLKRFNSIPEEKINLRSRAFSKSGYYIMRQDDLYMVIDCLPDEAGAPTGHRHNSRLSFELFADGTNFIIDPGSYVYTGDPGTRNLFRGTSSHNTVLIDGVEQNHFRKDDLFFLQPGGRINIHCWKSNDNYDYLDAEYKFHGLLKGNLKHRRQIYFAKKGKYWIIKDTLRGRGKHNFSGFFHFNEGLHLRGRSGAVIAGGKEGTPYLFISPMEKTKLSIEIVLGGVSKRYGIKKKAEVAAYQGTFKSFITFGFIIKPSRKPQMPEETLREAKERYRLLK